MVQRTMCHTILAILSPSTQLLKYSRTHNTLDFGVAFVTLKAILKGLSQLFARQRCAEFDR